MVLTSLALLDLGRFRLGCRYRWSMFVCLLSSSCLGQRIWKKLDTWTHSGTSSCSILGIWLRARHYFGIAGGWKGRGVLSFLFGWFFFLSWIKKCSKSKRKGNGMKTVMGGGCEKEHYCEAGIINSDPWWSLLSSYKSIGKKGNIIQLQWSL